MLRANDLATGAPDERDALRRAERLFEAAGHVGLDLSHASDAERRIATLACQDAPYLATLLTRDPARLARVAADPYLRREKPASVLIREVAHRTHGVTSADGLRWALRSVRADELVRLGARELELGLDFEVGRELARLADACFDAAIAFCDRELRARYGDPTYVDDDGVTRPAHLAVIGMGKLGGEELNFASDVDVIYVYSSDQGRDAGATSTLSLHEYFAKLATQITGALSQVTEDDVVFRVDLRLRPEGSKGAIANSLAQVERYYETFGRPWERQAWIKARTCAGDRALGDACIAMLQPFVFPRSTPPTIIDDVRDLNRRIKRELVRPSRKGADEPAGFDLKNGEGGIREIEFFVQALQLIHAGKRPDLRKRGTLAALDGLVFAGLVTDLEHRTLSEAYRWLRHAEHVLQLDGGLQTQTIPEDDHRRLVFARRLGYTASRAGVSFVVELERHTSAVSRLFATLGTAEAADDASELRALLRGELPADAEAAALAALGFVDVAAAQAELARARRPGSPLSPAADRRMTRIGAALFAHIARSPDPDQALRALGDLIAKRGQAWSMWRLFDESPALVRLVASIFGASVYLGRTLVDTPELIDLLVQVGQAPPARSMAQIAGDLARRIATADRADHEEVWSAIAEVKNGHVLRVGLADFAGALDEQGVCTELTAIAEACLRQALALVEDQLAARHPPPLPPRIAVLGLGKLGGGELGYASDLDVVFVHADVGDVGMIGGEAGMIGGEAGMIGGEAGMIGGEAGMIEWYARLAQRLLGALRQRTPRGRLYEVDTRLRPSGSQGLLVSSLAGWRRYHTEDARLWERQALIKLRPVAGDAALGEQVRQLAAQTVYGEPPEALGGPRAIAEAITSMREKIERELVGRTRFGDIKISAGGVMDVEFVAQYLQLVHGHDHPSLRTTSTQAALRAAAQCGVAPAAELELLDEGYRFLRRIEQRLRVVNDQPVHRLPEARDELDKLARRSGFPDGATLAHHVGRWQTEIRGAYRRLLGV
ncbi:MAG: bifunctional [glutamate--ammonia ligase]-adenylyl-L-tyrosine phosphorylase/[glutamate--ammonia-ligase] adenylyltransferase [Proteobacteria bacterium]|nr:bifunctional [glutamate--ammonia ligase]-adenylyl-L-tyrosine phosphorylase/[glutamate--ammonia-ligase] adenylyltransferase [Pseudomonadota bacterium]